MKITGLIFVMLAMLFGNTAITLDLISSFTNPEKSILTTLIFLGLAIIIGTGIFILAIIGIFKKVSIHLLITSIILGILSIFGNLIYCSIASLWAVFGSFLVFEGEKLKEQKLQSSNQSSELKIENLKANVIDPIDQLKKLKELKEAGTLTEEEFNKKKQILLDKI